MCVERGNILYVYYEIKCECKMNVEVGYTKVNSGKMQKKMRNNSKFEMRFSYLDISVSNCARKRSMVVRWGWEGVTSCICVVTSSANAK